MNALSGITARTPWCKCNEIKGNQGYRYGQCSELLERFNRHGIITPLVATEYTIVNETL